jgi:hypothetical protein
MITMIVDTQPQRPHIDDDGPRCVLCDRVWARAADAAATQVRHGRATTRPHLPLPQRSPRTHLARVRLPQPERSPPPAWPARSAPSIPVWASRCGPRSPKPSTPTGTPTDFAVNRVAGCHSQLDPVWWDTGSGGLCRLSESVFVLAPSDASSVAW